MDDAVELRHVATFVRDFEEGLDAAARGLLNGMARGDDCGVIVPVTAAETWRAGLSRSGISLPPEGDKGAVSIIPASEWLPPRGLNSILMSRRLWERAEEAHAASRAYYAVLDMTWTAEAGATADRVCHWEATCDHLASPDSRMEVLCVYDTTQLSTAFLHAALRTHASIDVGGRLVANPYFEAPAILKHEPDLNQCSDDPDVVQPMLQRFLPTD